MNTHTAYAAAFVSLVLFSSVHANENNETSGSNEDTRYLEVDAGQATLPEMIVTATRTEIPLTQVGVSATLIRGEEIEHRQARDVLELLRDVPAFSILQTGSRAGTTRLFVRGGEEDFNLVMIDGIQINRGGGEFSLADLTADNIERIEVLRGPHSSLYGSDAISSVINIISKRGEGSPRAQLIARGGSFDTIEERLSISGALNRFGYSASAGRYDTDGFLDLNNDANNTAVRGRFDLDLDWGLSTGLTLAYTDSEFNFPTDFLFGSGFPPIDPNQGRETEELVFGLDISHRPLSWWEQRLKFGFLDVDDLDFDPDDPIPSDTAARRTQSEERRISLDYRHNLYFSPTTWFDTTSTYGFELETENFDQEATRTPTGGATTTTLTDEFRRTWALYGQEQVAVGDRLFLTLGARLDMNSEFGDSLSPRGSIAYLIPSMGTKLRAAAGTGIKEPRFIENFGSATSTGNPDLDPEQSRSWEVGIDQALWNDKILFSMTYFDNAFTDLIAFLGPLGLPTSTFQNVQEAQSHGIETGLRIRFNDDLSLGGTYTFLETEVTDDGGVTSSAFVEGEELLRRPKHSGSFYIDYGWRDVHVHLNGTVIGSRVDRDFSTSFSGVRVKNEGFVKLDLAASYRLLDNPKTGRGLRLRVLIENLFDEAYEETFGIASPGISVVGGLEANF